MERGAESGVDSIPGWRKAIAGLRGSSPAPVPQSPALIVVDMQRYFLEKGAPAYLGAEEIIPNVQRLVEAFASLRFPIFATRYFSTPSDGPIERWWGTRLEPDDPWSELDPRLAYPKPAVVLDKHLYGAFSTDIDARLRQTSCDSVVVCGVMTHLCCETTAREAFQHGYDVYFVADANATSRQETHISTLRALAHGFAHVLGTKEMVELLGGERG
jgi:bifunctional isochorismate lyase/aryl carrier protein